jgi:hypothetical protein
LPDTLEGGEGSAEVALLLLCWVVRLPSCH